MDFLTDKKNARDELQIHLENAHSQTMCSIIIKIIIQFAMINEVRGNDVTQSRNVMQYTHNWIQRIYGEIAITIVILGIHFRTFDMVLRAMYSVLCWAIHNTQPHLVFTSYTWMIHTERCKLQFIVLKLCTNDEQQIANSEQREQKNHAFV